MQGLFKGHLWRPDIIIIKRADHRGTKGGQNSRYLEKKGRPFRSLKGPGLEGIAPVDPGGEWGSRSCCFRFWGEVGRVGHAGEVRGKT